VEDPDLDPGQVILISGHAEEDVADLVAASPSLGFVNKSELSAAVIQQLLNGSGGTASRPPSSGRLCRRTPRAGQVLDDVGAAGALDGGDRVAVAQGVSDVVQVVSNVRGDRGRPVECEQQLVPLTRLDVVDERVVLEDRWERSEVLDELVPQRLVGRQGFAQGDGELGLVGDVDLQIGGTVALPTTRTKVFDRWSRI
jgi:hypothetical protein